MPYPPEQHEGAGVRVSDNSARSASVAFFSNSLKVAVKGAQEVVTRIANTGLRASAQPSAPAMTGHGIPPSPQCPGPALHTAKRRHNSGRVIRLQVIHVDAFLLSSVSTSCAARINLATPRSQRQTQRAKPFAVVRVFRKLQRLMNRLGQRRGSRSAWVPNARPGCSRPGRARHGHAPFGLRTARSARIAARIERADHSFRLPLSRPRFHPAAVLRSAH